MSFCIKCGKEIPQDCRFCRNCGTRAPLEPGRTLQKSEGPKVGLIIISIYFFLCAIFSLIGLALIDPDLSFFFGVKVPVAVMAAVNLIGIAVFIFCGIGFLKRMNLARLVYIVYAVFTIIIAIPNTIAAITAIQAGKVRKF